MPGFSINSKLLFRASPTNSIPLTTSLAGGVSPHLFGHIDADIMLSALDLEMAFKDWKLNTGGGSIPCIFAFVFTDQS